jgi:hypothetical protein
MVAAPLHSDERITLDGRLEEPVWRRGMPATGFLQTEPVEGGPASERTEVRVAYDSDHLYIGARLADSDPAGILGHQRQRDAGLGSDDRFMWILDTFLDGRSGYFFEINPAGLMGDGLLRRGAARRSTSRGTASGRRESTEAISAGPPRSAFRSGRSTSTRASTPGVSTSSARCGARTRSCSGADTVATRDSFGR